VAPSLEEALDLARRPEGNAAPEEIAVIGGGEIYRQAMAIADRLHVTHVEAEIEGDTLFPPIDPDIWKAVSRGYSAGEQGFAPDTTCGL
jgi:dihydrofolate reductase